MPVGSFSFTPTPVPLGRLVPATGVFRYDAKASTYEFLPNVRWLRIEVPGEGPEPGAAQFRYTMGDPFLDATFPIGFEQFFSQTAQGNGIVQNDDRLVVLAFLDDGSARAMFDGFAQIPQADVSGDGEIVSFQALGAFIREWDTPLTGAIYADGADPSTSSKNFQTDLPARFNPDGVGNCNFAGNEVNAGQSDEYDVFLDAAFPDTWTISRSAKYIIQRGNPDETYITNADAALVDEVFDSRKPVAAIIDPEDPNSYTDSPIITQDIDVRGDPWPVALWKLIEPHNFAFRDSLSLDSNGFPRHDLEVYRRDVQAHIKSLSLQAYGAVLDPGQSNVGALRMARDIAEVYNQVVIDSAATAYEGSVVLSPLFTIAGADADDDQATRDMWKQGEASFDPVKYREYGVDEIGDGHWNFGTSSTDNTPCDFSLIFPKAQGSKTNSYANRRRPGRHTLFSVDANKKPLRAELWVSKDYAGPIPGVWDGTGTWQQVKHGGWELLKEQLGIRLTVSDVRDWNIGKTDIATPVTRSGKLNVVKSLATNDTVHPRFYFRLTCVIDSDQDLDVVATKRIASPTRFAIERHVDTRDRFVKEIIDTSSIHANGAAPKASRDDTDNAQHHADAIRKAHETGLFAGSVMIPRLTFAYSVGDPVDTIRGRGVTFATNTGLEQGEGAVYPVVAAISYTSSPLATHLQLSDRRAMPARERTT